MYAFITIGTNNLKKSSYFYDEIFKILEIPRVVTDERYVGYSKEKNKSIADFYIMKPFDKNDATVGNGTMITFEAKTIEIVNAIHKIALELGAVNEGKPGPRHGEHYFAYFKDLDGNKICVFCSD